MKQKKLFTLISAAVIALTAIPVLPVTAAAETAPPAAEETVKNPFEAFTPGFDYAEYGFIDCTAYFEKPETDSYYIGIRVKLAQPEVTVNLVSEAKNRTAGSGKKFAVIEVNRVKYDLICSDDRSEYWCIPSEAAEKLTYKAELNINSFLKAIENAGLPVGTLEAIEPLSSAGMESYQVSMNMQNPVLKDIGSRGKVIDRGGELLYSCELYQSPTPKSGEAWITPGADNGFTASWKNLPENSFTLFGSTTRYINPVWDNASEFQHYHYAADADLQNAASVGIAMTNVSINPRSVVQVNIIDAWNEKRPEYEEHLGTFELNCGVYDLYFTKQEYIVGDYLTGESLTENRDVYVAVRKENLLRQTGAGKIENTVNLSAFVREFSKYGLNGKDQWIAGAAVFVSEGTGTVTITKNEPETVKLEGRGGIKMDTTADGYFWKTVSEHPFTYKYEEGGRLSASWNESEYVELYCGKYFQEPVTAESLGQIDYHYAADVTLKNDAYAGTYVEFADADNSSEAGMRFVLADAYSGKLPAPLEAFGTYVLHGEKYDIYWLPNLDKDHNYYWIVRQNNLLGTEKTAKIENTVDLTGHFAAMEKLGVSIREIRQISVFASAQTVATGSVAFTKNEMQLSEINERPLEQYFRLGKTLVIPDYDENDSIYEFHKRFEIASLENILIPTNCLNAMWKPDQPIEITLDVQMKKFLASCEANGIPVVIGPFISGYNLPTAYYKDADGSFVKPEVMQERYDAIIKAMFGTLAKEYPDLVIDSAIVTSEVYVHYAPFFPNEMLTRIYGEGNTDYVAAAFKSAKKYAPEGCRLYMEEILNPEPTVLTDVTDGEEIKTTDTSDIKQIADAAEALKQAKVPVDGIALCAGFDDENDWRDENSYFNTALNMLSETGLDLILSDVTVSVRPAYDDIQRVKIFKAAFADFIRNSDKISMVLLSDYHGMQDGPHPISQIEDFDTVIPDALAMQKPKDQSGDVNCDGSIDVSDAVLLARFLAEDKTVNIGAQGRINCDANGDSNVSSDDVIHILRVIAKII